MVAGWRSAGGGGDPSGPLPPSGWCSCPVPGALVAAAAVGAPAEAAAVFVTASPELDWPLREDSEGGETRRPSLCLAAEDLAGLDADEEDEEVALWQ